MTRQHKRARQTERFRIIGGQWRGRRFNFPAIADIRPTPDRVRETVFNWLQPYLPGARCLDLYAGSGAMGLEALSRGAGEVVFVDRETRALDAIGDHLKAVGSPDGKRVRSDARQYISGAAASGFDLVLLDPPFSDLPWDWLFPALAVPGVIKSGARIYFEQGASEPMPLLPEGWKLVRSKRAGRVGYHLAVCEKTESA